MLYNLYCTHRAPPALAFPHVLRARRDRGDPQLGPHLDGFVGYVMDRGKRPMTATRYAVYRHIQRVRHHLAVEVDDAHAAALAAWARAANALVFLTDGSVRAPDGAVLVDPRTGDPAPGAQVPHPEDTWRRKSASESTLARAGIRVPEHLPPVVSEVEVELRSPAEVGGRALALLVCAVRAESLADGGEPIAPEELCDRVALEDGILSPRELAFLEDDEPDDQDVIDHAWRYEALAVLAWALELRPDLPFPSAIVDAGALSRAVLDADPARFRASARLRPAAAILDALDLTYRLHWATTEARVQGVEPSDGVEPGVVMERHRALNWLVRFEDAAWDEVDTPT